MGGSDIKSRITCPQTLLPLNDEDLQRYITGELTAVRLGSNTFDDGAVELILRSAQGNLRLCRNLCYGSLVEACCQNKRIEFPDQLRDALYATHGA